MMNKDVITCIAELGLAGGNGVLFLPFDRYDISNS